MLTCKLNSQITSTIVEIVLTGCTSFRKERQSNWEYAVKVSGNCWFSVNHKAWETPTFGSIAPSGYLWLSRPSRQSKIKCGLYLLSMNCVKHVTGVGFLGTESLKKYPIIHKARGPNGRGTHPLFEDGWIKDKGSSDKVCFGSFGLLVQARPHNVITPLITQTSFRRYKLTLLGITAPRPTSSSLVQLSSVSAIIFTPITNKMRTKGVKRGIEKYCLNRRTCATNESYSLKHSTRLNRVAHYNRVLNATLTSRVTKIVGDCRQLKHLGTRI